jgi:GPH family glycoside/pentoside/hexuronide:cation symporter
MKAPSDKHSVSTTPSTASPSLLTTKQKIAWGAGGFPENLANNALLSLVNPIFNIGLGLSPALIGLAVSISRVLDAFTDPMMGNISDNLRTRWGRRRPWIFLGAIVMSVFFILTWFPSPGWSDSTIAVFLGINCALFYVGFTMWGIPYGALGMELEADYDRRTRLMTYRIVAGVIGGFLSAFLYRICLLEIFGDDSGVVGVKYVGVGVGILIFVSAAIPAVFVQERFAEQVSKKLNIWKALKYTLQDKPFLMLQGYSFLLFIGLFMASPLLVYIYIYYVAQGDRAFGGTLNGLSFVPTVVVQLLMMPFIAVVCKYVEKKTLLMVGLSVASLGYASTWFLFSPSHPYISLIPPIICNAGLSFGWVLNPSLTADICDYDEYRTGRRREGMYGAVGGFIYKVAIGVVLLLSGVVLQWAGFGEGVKEFSELPEGAVTRVRIVYATFPTACLCMAMLLMWKYPLNRKAVADLKSKLEAMRAHSSDGSAD